MNVGRTLVLYYIEQRTRVRLGRRFNDSYVLDINILELNVSSRIYVFDIFHRTRQCDTHSSQVFSEHTQKPPRSVYGII